MMGAQEGNQDHDILIFHCGWRHHDILAEVHLIKMLLNKATFLVIRHVTLAHIGVPTADEISNMAHDMPSPTMHIMVMADEA